MEKEKCGAVRWRIVEKEMREGEALARHRHWQVAANRSNWHRQERSRCQSSSASSVGSDPFNKRRSVPRLIGVNEGQANDKQSRSARRSLHR